MDAAALLYLNPELEASGAATTVAAALALSASDPTAFDGMASNLPTPPAGFDARVYLAAQPDISGTNATIRQAMLSVGLTPEAVERRGTFVATIIEDVVPSATPLRSTDPAPPADPTFALAYPEVTPFRFGACNLQAGDWLRLQRVSGARQGDTLQARVVGASDDGLRMALDAATYGGSAARSVGGAQSNNGGDVWRVVGLRVWDAQRQALVALSRAQLAASNASAAAYSTGFASNVPPDDVGPRGDFDLMMYHSVYPSTKQMGLPDTYLDYRTRWRRDTEFRVINGRDIFNLSAPYTSNLLSSGGTGTGGGTGGGSGGGNPTLGGGETFYGLVTAPTVLALSNLSAGGNALSNAFLRVTGSNLAVGAPNGGTPLLRALAYAPGPGGGGLVDVAGGALTADALTGVVRLAGGSASGGVVVLPSGDVVAGGAASNLAVAQATRTVSVGSELQVGGRVGIGMACSGSETAAAAAADDPLLPCEWYEQPPTDAAGCNAALSNAFFASGCNVMPAPSTLSLCAGGTRLAVAGDIFATGTVVTLSDARFKADVRPIDDALSRVRRLNGYTFSYEFAAPAADDAAGGDLRRRHTGLLAHEVRAAMPEAVYAAPGRVASVAYGNLVGLLVEAIKELAQRVERRGDAAPV